MKNRARALTVMIAVLLIGCILGIAGHRSWEMWFRGRTTASSGPQIQRQTDRLAKRLQLTTEQEVRLKAILEDSRLQINAGRTELQSKMETIRARTNEKITAILTDDQRKTFQQLLSEAGAHRHTLGHGEGRGGHEQQSHP